MTDGKDKWAQLFGRDTAKSKSPELVVNHEVEKPPYVAFETQDKLLGFVAHCPSTQMGHQFFYHHLHTITFNEPDYNFVFITTSTSVIRVYGHDLQPLALALGLHTCKSLTEFHKDFFATPKPDDGKPFIEKIEVALIKGAGDSQQGVASKQREEV